MNVGKPRIFVGATFMVALFAQIIYRKKKCIRFFLISGISKKKYCISKKKCDISKKKYCISKKKCDISKK